MNSSRKYTLYPGHVEAHYTRREKTLFVIAAATIAVAFIGVTVLLYAALVMASHASNIR